MHIPSRPPALWALALAAGLSACAPAGGKAARSEPSAKRTASGEAGYLATPEVAAASRLANGAVLLIGRAAPNSRVRLASPERDTFDASAGPDGTWRLELPPTATARMFAVSAQTAGRPIHAQGALLALPAPARPALTLRAGYGALVAGQPGVRPAIVAVDYDPSGFAAVAGLAQPRAPVRLSLDGATSGESRADPQGRFAILAPNHPLAPGAHAVAVSTPGGQAEVTVQIAPPQPLSQPYRGERQAGAWRIDWTPPGPEGGVQTTLVLDQPGQGS